MAGFYRGRISLARAFLLVSFERLLGIAAYIGILVIYIFPENLLDAFLEAAKLFVREKLPALQVAYALLDILDVSIVSLVLYLGILISIDLIKVLSISVLFSWGKPTGVLPFACARRGHKKNKPA